MSFPSIERSCDRSCPAARRLLDLGSVAEVSVFWSVSSVLDSVASAFSSAATVFSSVATVAAFSSLAASWATASLRLATAASTWSWLASAFVKTFWACSSAVFKRERESSVFPVLSKPFTSSTNWVKASLLTTLTVGFSATTASSTATGWVVTVAGAL